MKIPKFLLTFLHSFTEFIFHLDIFILAYLPHARALFHCQLEAIVVVVVCASVRASCLCTCAWLIVVGNEGGGKRKGSKNVGAMTWSIE